MRLVRWGCAGDFGAGKADLGQEEGDEVQVGAGVEGVLGEPLG